MSKQQSKISVRVMEAASMTSMPHTAIRRAIYARQLPVIQFARGKPYYILVTDLVNWLNTLKRTL
jgi:hypothetical protein